MKILVTGGVGYIGTHTLIELYAAGHTAVVVDNLSNSNPVALKRVAEIIGVPEIPFYKVDIRDREGLEQVFAEHGLTVERKPEARFTLPTTAWREGFQAPDADR